MYIIGLTGNIASGKSTVRQMLEQMGAYTIDADALAHAVLLKGTPAWRAVVDAFGVEVLHPDGEVDRQKLGALVFADPVKLQRLEAITHPAVSVQLALMLRDLSAPMVVVEAIKLIEAGLYLYCDAVWIVTTPPAEAKRRLIQERGLSDAEAEVRLRAQPPLEDKLKHATAVLDNGGNIEATRMQVVRAFASLRPQNAADKTPMLTALLGLTPHVQAPPVGVPASGHPDSKSPAEPTSSAPVAEPPRELHISVRRARPSDIGMLATALAQAEGSNTPISRAETLRRFGKWGYWLTESEGRTLALAAWRAENLVAMLRDLWTQSPALAPRVFPPLFAAIEQEAQSLVCEVAIVMTNSTNDTIVHSVLVDSGYNSSSLEEMHKLWRGVAQTEVHTGETIYLTRLREELVTKPF